MLAITTAYLMFVYVEACNPERPGECDLVSRPVEAFQDPAECEQEAFKRNKDNLSYMYGEFWKCYLHTDEKLGEVE